MLTVQGVTVRRGGRALIEDHHWTVPDGAVTVVLGPNGAGKTTALKVLSGDLRPDAGQVWLNDRPLPDWPVQELACRRAVVPQAGALAFPFTVEEVVTMGRAPHRRRSWAARDAAVVADALSATDLTALAQRPYPGLSGGEKQRVHLARALAQLDGAPDGQRTLLLDEPTAALDPAHQHQCMRLARRMADDGAAVAVILHDLALALRYADRLVLLRQGRVMAEGPVADTATADILSAVYDCPVRLLRVPGEALPVVVTG
ncbi:heme ABC transporter ATP-binding protein [Novispirillum itersonii]|uniref:Iron complex transport system ATP-binding protein n=1 Tax=Novispirillum itersonii TaxID=189 RepID=A0A7W9ZE67_NOVIT|nr:heme ABC transporter ATP-binding protein [Novispirillum itersonii]MBB6208649.1 iron complex transport system ATP-binding protein [Novispirillum itersonii]